jgi:hypothetical protein
MGGYSSMIIEAKKLKNGTLINKYEVRLECVYCGMKVDAEEYKSGTCSDCGKEWAEKKHVGVYVTSIPLSAQTS